MINKMYKVNGSADGSCRKLYACLLSVLLLSGGIELQAAPTPVPDTRTDMAAAQQSDTRKIRGTVKDESGTPVIGASVIIAGTTTGTTTDLNGAYELSGPGEEFRIEVSFIGYKNATVSVAAGITNCDVTLSEDTMQMDEVVVVGYGTMRKKDLTGATGMVKGDDLASRRTTDVTSALQGAVAGLMVTRDGGDPSASATLQIRGVTSIGESAPLVIVDGVPGDINHVNPEDIESISVLKDAASASIYGSRAAAGVVVITTKRAQQEELSLSYSYEHGWQMPTDLPEFVGVQRYMEMFNELRYNDNPSGGWYQRFTEDEVANWITNNKTDPDKYPIVNWQKELMKKSASRQSHSVNLSAGGKTVRSKVSFRYDESDGLYVNKNWERFVVRANNDFKINKFIEAHLNFDYSRSESVSPNVNPFQIQNMQIPSIYAARWTNGMWGDVKDGANTLARITDGGTNSVWYNRAGGKASVDISPVKGLKISAVVAPNYNFYKRKQFKKQVPYTFADDPNTIRGYMGDCFTTDLAEYRNDDWNITSQVFANYAVDLGKHNITAMVGYEDYYAFWEELSASRDQFRMSNFPYLDAGPDDYRNNSGTAFEYAYRSVFGRLTYNYDNRYLLQANLRYDGSSRFAKGNRWASFPSFSAGWVISEEKFLKQAESKWLSYLKLRGSWGALGNERIGSYYPYQASINFSNALFVENGAVVSDLTAAQWDYAVRDISWETTTTWDVGLDAALFNNRLSLTADYYQKDTKNMLLGVQIPGFVGFNSPQVNAGKMHTKGYDIEIAWRDKVKDFQYSIALNFSDFISRMGDMNGTRQFDGDRVKFEGSEFNEWYGYLSDGLFLSQADLDASPKLNNNVQVGDVKYKDISGPDGVPDGVISPEYDRVLLGGSLPRYMFGLNFNASWKGFDFGIVLQGVLKQNARLTSMMVEGFTNQWGDFPKVLDGNYWSSTKTDAENAAARYPRLTYSNRNSNYVQMSDYWLFDGRYMRLKNITLGYTLPTRLTKKAYIQKARVYVAANDVGCWHNYPKGWDPERAAGNTAGYPITTTLMVGASIQF